VDGLVCSPHLYEGDKVLHPVRPSVCLSVCLSRAYDLREVREAHKLKFIGDIMLLNDYQVQIRKEPVITNKRKYKRGTA